MTIEIKTHAVIPLIYVLELEDDCWYVGYSESVNKRLASHFSGNGSLWCKEHKPISVYEIFPGTKEDENRKTLELMKVHGISKVRGGVYTKVEGRIVSYEVRAKHNLLDYV